MKPSEYLTDYQAVVNSDPQKIVTLDFETYYNTEEKYDLRHMSMEEYIRDPRFLVQGVGVKLGGKPARWIYGHANVSKFFNLVPLDTNTVLGHNMHFDGLVLSEIYNVRPKAILDTMAMARLIYGNCLRSVSLANLVKEFLPGLAKDSTALHNVNGKRVLTIEEAEELGDYCAGPEGDCFLTHELYKFFLPKLLESPLNCDLIDNVTRMFTSPALMLDHDVLQALLAREIVEKQEALDNSVATSLKQLRSNKQFATLLEANGTSAPMKTSPTTGKETYAFAQTDREFMAMERDPNPIIAKLVQARLRVKTSINETRARKYLAVEGRGAWPVHLNISGACTTHRLSGGPGGGGNPQNLGGKSPLREAIKPPEGFKMFAIDSANIELRVAMCVSGEHAVASRLRDPDFDLYSLFATSIYNVELREVDKAKRKVGKIACLQLQYGSGGATFRDMAWSWGVDLTREESERIKNLYRASFDKMPRVWSVMERIIRQLGRGVAEETWFDHLVRPVVDGPGGHPAMLLVETGTYITYPNLKQEYDEQRRGMQWTYDTYDGGSRRLVRTSLYGSKMFGHCCQALARNVVLEQQVALDTYLKQEINHECMTVASIHDEAICLVPEHADTEQAIEGAREIFGTSPAWWPELPVFGEASYGDNYSECK